MTSALPIRLEFDHNGFSVFTDGVKTDSVEWDRVREIIAYRREPAARDVLTLGFRVTAGQEYVEIPETLKDYPALLERMYEQFPRLSPDWWQAITREFGSNRTTIYGLPLAEQLQTDASARFLLELQRTGGRRRRWRRRIRRGALAGAGLLLAAGVQQGIVAAVFALAGGRPGGGLRAMTLLAGPALLAVGVARWMPLPRRFLALLVGFHVFDGLVGYLAGPAGGTLAAMLAVGRWSYLLLLGAEILAGMVAMLLPSRRALEKLNP